MSVSDLIRNVRKLNPSELEGFLEQLRLLENQSAGKKMLGQIILNGMKTLQ